MSHSYTFSMTRDQIITRALQIVGAIDPGQAPDIVQINTAAVELNMLLKSYVNEGFIPWKYETFVLFPRKGQVRYDLHQNTDVEWTTENQLAWSNLTENTDEDFTQLLVEGPSSNIMSPFNNKEPEAGDRIGIRMSDQSLVWRTIDSVGPFSGNLQITVDELVEGVALQGARVYFYSTPKAHIPHKILNVTRRDDNDHDTPLHPVSFKDYQWLTRKATSPGVSTQYTYKLDQAGHLEDQHEYSSFYLWAPPQNTRFRFYMMGTRLFHDLISGVDKPDVPAEWLQALTWELASNLSIEYALDSEHETAIARKAGMFKEKALAASAEGQYVRFEPDIRFGNY